MINVYAIRAGESTRVKIGISQAPMQRLANLQTASPEPLELLYTMPVANARAVEQLLHAKLASYRLQGEWFHLPEEVMCTLWEQMQAAAAFAEGGREPSSRTSGGAWTAAMQDIRARMAAQPRGYQAKLAATLQKTPGFVNQIVTGHRPLPIEHLDDILASLNLEYDVILRDREGVIAG